MFTYIPIDGDLSSTLGLMVSRLPAYCCCSTDNRADTVFQLFLDAVDVYGLPSRVRCDRGTENYDVGYCMLSHPLRGPNRRSVIPGQCP